MNERGYGWIVFASIMLGVAGVMRIFDAIWAFSYHGVLPADLEGAVFGHSLKTYGWVYLAVAAVLIVCAFAVLNRSQMARWIGIVAGGVACVSAVWWMPYYPIWSLTYVALGALVVYALAAYGGPESDESGYGSAGGRRVQSTSGDGAAGGRQPVAPS